MLEIIWSDYFRHRVKLRGFDLQTIEQILKCSTERYTGHSYDAESDRLIVVGKHENRLVVIACEQNGIFITPTTIHTVTRPKIRLRLRTGRFTIDE